VDSIYGCSICGMKKTNHAALCQDCLHKAMTFMKWGTSDIIRPSYNADVNEYIAWYLSKSASSFSRGARYGRCLAVNDSGHRCSSSSEYAVGESCVCKYHRTIERKRGCPFKLYEEHNGISKLEIAVNYLNGTGNATINI
jgi:hypothetical protein